MKIYLDLCVYNRPFDDQSQPRIMMETLGFVIIMALVSSGDIKTVNSFVLEYENEQNPKLDNKIIIADMLQAATRFVEYTERIHERAEILEGLGIMGMDALHLACAEYADSDFLVTCDDAFIKKVQRINSVNVNVVTLLEFVSTEVI